MDGRVVGGLGLAARGLHRTGEHLLAYGSKRGRARSQTLDDAFKIKRARIDRIVDTGVRDETAHVKGLGNTHGARGRDALGGSGCLQGRGVERNRGLLLARALGHLGDGARRRVLDMCKCSLRRSLIGKARRLVRNFEFGVSSGAHATNLPIILGDKGHSLALALDDQRKRRSLDATGGTYVAKAAKFGERQVARKHRAPNQVDILAALAGICQILIKLNKIIERSRDLSLDECRVARTRSRHVGGNLTHHLEGIGTDELALAVEVGSDDDGIGLLGQILKDADDLALRRILDDGRPREVREALHLPALDIDTVRQVRAAFALVRRACKAIGHVGRQDLALFGQ